MVITRRQVRVTVPNTIVSTKWKEKSSQIMKLENVDVFCIVGFKFVNVPHTHHLHHPVLHQVVSRLLLNLYYTNYNSNSSLAE